MTDTAASTRSELRANVRACADTRLHTRCASLLGRKLIEIATANLFGGLV